MTKKYLIYKDSRSDYEDIFGDFHLKDFLSIWEYDKKNNRKSIKYYKACTFFNESVEYDWFMDQIENYFRLFENLEVERGFEKIWGIKYEYILLEMR